MRLTALTADAVKIAGSALHPQEAMPLDSESAQVCDLLMWGINCA